MAIEKENILFFTRTMGLGGTEKVILQLCDNFKGKFNKIVVCSSGGIHEKDLEKSGIKHYKINDIENKNLFTCFKILIEVIKIIRRENINIIHTHHRMAAFYTWIISKFIRIKFVHTAHNTFFDKKFLTKLILKKANVIAVGNRVKDNLVSFYGLNSDNIKVIYNGISNTSINNIKKIDQIEEYRSKGYFIVGNIGRLSEQKGFEYYIKAACDVIKENKKVMFFIIGDGEEREKLRKLCEKLKVEDYVIFLGYRNDVINVIKQLDLVVLSSLWEGLPLTPIETFSVGKTIVATDVDGTSEIVKNNYNGVLVKKKDAKGLATEILSLSKDKDKLNRLEINAYKTYNEKFNINIFNKNYEEYYKEIIG